MLFVINKVFLLLHFTSFLSFFSFSSLFSTKMIFILISIIIIIICFVFDLFKYWDSFYTKLFHRIKIIDEMQNHDFWKQAYIYEKGDVAITPPAKSGTTLVMHIAHQLRVQGAPVTFKDQNDVISWPDLLWSSPSQNQQQQQQQKHLEVKQVAWPRLFKTHAPFHKFPQEIKKIFMMRNPEDTLISAFKFLPNSVMIDWKTLPASRILIIMALKMYPKFFTELVEWWKARKDPNVLFLCFETTAKSRKDTIKKIATFINVPCSEQVLQKVFEQTSHQEMSSPEHFEKFKDASVALKLAKAYGYEFNPDILTGKVRKDGGNVANNKKSNENNSIPFLCKLICKLNWKYYVTSQLGFKNYEEMKLAFEKEYY